MEHYAGIIMCGVPCVNSFVDVCTRVDWPSISIVVFLAEQSSSSVPSNSPIFSTLSLQDALFQFAIHPIASSPSSPSFGAQHVLPDRTSNPNASSIFLAVDSFDESFLGLQTHLIKIHFLFAGIVLSNWRSAAQDAPLDRRLLTLVACSLLLT